MNNLHNLLSMGIYGKFVWSAYAIAFAVFCFNAGLAYVEKKSIFKQLRRQKNL